MDEIGRRISLIFLGETSPVVGLNARVLSPKHLQGVQELVLRSAAARIRWHQAAGWAVHQMLSQIKGKTKL